MTSQELSDEVTLQDESITRLSREKKAVEDQLHLTSDDLQSEEDKNNHLLKVKHKLEQALDDVSVLSVY